MACEDHAVPFLAESSAIGNTQRRDDSTHKQHHNPQADALQCPLDNFLTRYMDSPILRRKSRQPCTNFKKAVVQVNQCAELNNTNCVLSYTFIGDHASNGSWQLSEYSPFIPCLWGNLRKPQPLVGKAQFLARLSSIPGRWT